ncbi:Developmentally-regulated GTP-binding protein 2 [Binucleata daphniae]
MGILERIQEIEVEMARTQKNKKTEYHMGCLKARLAKLRKDLLAPKQSANTTGFEIQKMGDARVTLIGFPSVGKSTLISKITTTLSKAAEHEFTTLTCISGKLCYKGAQIQILDLPGIIKGAAQGIGRGKQVISLARTSDLILMMLDPRRIEDKETLEKELYEMGIRLNKSKPDVTLTLTSGGGVNVNTTINLTKTDENMIKLVLKEYKINNCMVVIREDVSVDEIIDVVCGNAVYIKCLYCFNKIDAISIEDLKKLDAENNVCVSSKKEWNFDELYDEMWNMLGMKRIYTKRKGEFPDLQTPVVLRESKNIKDLCMELHKDFVTSFKYALVWGTSAKHMPQKVGLGHVLEDEDVVQIYTA